jgi:hypothetical protein
MQLMELRTHSKMKWEGFSNWPPVWAGSADILPEREERALTGVEMVEADDTSPRHLVLTMEHRESIFSSVLHCDDEEVVPQLLEILEGCIGWQIGRIGDLEVDL